MIGHRATAGLALLCALMFSALAAQSAMAQKGTKAVNTTAVTCVKVGVNKGEFQDPHCDEKVGPEKGEYGHLSIKNDETTELEVTQEGTSILNATLGGVATEVGCKKGASVKEKSFIHNILSESTKHTVTGTVQINFSECEVKKPAKCIIKEPIKATATFEGVEGLNPNTKNEMGTEYRGEGESGAFAELFFENKGAEKCSLLNGGKPSLVLGSAIATGKTATQKEKYSGATSVFEPGPEANKMETIEIGLKPATFTGTFTVWMAGGNPISVTTVT